jgi:phosphoribosylglycinamide formyltransferase 1
MSSQKARVAVFISGNGSDLQALIDASKASTLDAQIVLVVSSNPEAYGLTRAKVQKIDTFVFVKKNYPTPHDADKALMEELRSHQVDYVALAGYLKMIPTAVLKAYPDRVVNIHPALLPKYGGKGMYGHFVHEAVIANGETESGPTVHLVDEIYDHGKILEQARVDVLPDDTPETLAARVLDKEHELYPIALNKLIKGAYRI